MSFYAVFSIGNWVKCFFIISGKNLYTNEHVAIKMVIILIRANSNHNISINNYGGLVSEINRCKIKS